MAMCKEYHLAIPLVLVDVDFASKVDRRLDILTLTSHPFYPLARVPRDNTVLQKRVKQCRLARSEKYVSADRCDVKIEWGLLCAGLFTGVDLALEQNTMDTTLLSAKRMVSTSDLRVVDCLLCRVISGQARCWHPRVREHKGETDQVQSEETTVWRMGWRLTGVMSPPRVS